MSPEEIVKTAFQLHRDQNAGGTRFEFLAFWKNIQQLNLALRSLTTEQGQRIAEDVWRDFNPKEDGYLLTRLGASVPSALATIQDDMVERGVFYPPHLYLGANDGVAGKLVEMVSPPTIEESRNLLLLCLAWIGNDRVVRQFQAWRENPPVWLFIGSRLGAHARRN